MKILVISDTHYRINNALSVIGRLSPTHIFHLGDMVSDADDIKSVFPHIEMYNVRGNNDFLSQAPDDRLVEIGGVKYFLTHGHKYGVKAGTSQLSAYAKSIGASFALFGHTHRTYDKEQDGLRLLNPSSDGFIVIKNNLVEVNKY